MTRARPSSGLMRHSALVLLCVLVGAPFLWMLLLSLLAPQSAAALALTHLPQFAVVENYRRAATDVPLLRFELNGILICAAAVSLGVLTGAPAAYALAKLKVPGTGVMIATILVAMMIPREVTAIPVFLGLYKAGLLDTYAALILPSVVSPLTIFLLYQVFRAVPDDFVHAARLDGMSEWTIVWAVMVPLALPALATVAILTVIGRWNDLFWPTTVVTSMHLMPPPMGIALFHDQEAGSDYGPLMAATTLVVTPLVVAFSLTQQRFIDSFTGGGRK